MRVWRCRWNLNYIVFLPCLTILPFIIYFRLLQDFDKHPWSAENFGGRFLRFVSSTPQQDLDLRKTTLKFAKTPKIFNSTCAGTDVCLKKQVIKWRLVAVAKSSPGHFQRRKDIRSTWGSVRFMYGGRFDVVFLMGNDRSTDSKLLQKEHELYRDILQFNEEDKIKHVPVKSLAELQWASEYLSDQHLILFTNDKVELDPVAFLNYTNATIHKARKNDWPEFPLVCPYDQVKTMPVSRNKLNRLYASKEQFQWKSYPQACASGTFLTSAAVVKQFYTESRKVRHLRNENVWVTGILRKRIGLPDKMMLEAPENVIFNLEGSKTATNSSKKLKDSWIKKLSLQKSVPKCTCSQNV